MSEVQKRVLSLMPYLSGGKLRGVAREEGREGREPVENDVEEDEAGERRGREDLLVKARTGTGKTIVRRVLAGYCHADTRRPSSSPRLMPESTPSST